VYAIPALSLRPTTKQIDELNVCWNSVIRKVFGYQKWESVSAVLLGLGRLKCKTSNYVAQGEVLLSSVLSL